MLTPVELSQYTDRITGLYRQLETDIITDMARRIGEAQYAQSSLDWLQYVYTEINGNQKELVDRLTRLTNLSRKEVLKVFKRAGIQSSGFDNKIYQQAYDAGIIPLPPIPLLKSPRLTNILIAGIENTNRTLENFTQSIIGNVNIQFKTALDRAYLQVSSGAFSYNQAIKQTVKELATNGVGMVEYPSGHRSSLEAVVRRAVLSGINMTCGVISEAQADELGATTVGTTAHYGARNTGEGYENHESWQGKWFSYKGRNPEYPEFIDSCGFKKGGGIGGWNCRHGWTIVFPGLSKPAYDPKDYEKEVRFDGKTASYFDATQRQRQIERNIRHWKRQVDALKASGSDHVFESTKLGKWNKIMKSFLDETGFKRDPNREWVY